MTTITAEQAENEAARNWCAGLLAGAGSRIEGDVAKRWVDIGVGILLSIYKDEKLGDEEKSKRCKEVYAAARAAHPLASMTVCEVGGERYTLCTNCPLRTAKP